MIKLLRPDESIRDEILSFREEFARNNEKTIPGSELLDKMDSFDEWLSYVRKNENKDTVSSDWVVTDIFFLEDSGHVCGVISFRHQLNDFLKDFGHVGYSVRPTQRKKGYATHMLEEVIKIAKDIGLHELILSAENDNTASLRTIEKFNPTLIRSYPYLEKTVSQYMIKI